MPVESIRGAEARPWRKLVLWNALANYSGRIWSAVLNVAIIPVYVRLLGPEAYGLIGVFAVLQGSIQLFDVGLSATLNRELARLPKGEGSRKEAADLVRTLEIVYWLFGLAATICLFVSAPVIASHWLNAVHLSERTVSRSLALMGLVIAISWPCGLYGGGLLGLEKHVRLNAVQAGINTLRFGGAVVVLMAIDRSITAYFVWQLGVSALQAICLRTMLWREVAPGPQRGAFNPALLRGRARLMAGISSTYIAVIALTQADKLLVSRFVNLKEFGYYTLAWGLMNVFFFVYYPLSTAVFPRLTDLCARGEANAAADLYCLASQVTALGVFPACAIFCFFPTQVASLWLAGDVGARVAVLVRWLAPAAALSAFMSLSNMFQWAHGSSKAGLWTNAAGLTLLAPLVIWASIVNGILGAAMAVSAVRIAQAIAQFDWAHREFLRTRRIEWYRTIAICAAASIVPALGCRKLLPPTSAAITTAAVLVCVWSIATGAAVLATPCSRPFLIRRVHRVTTLLSRDSTGAPPCNSLPE